MLSLRYDLRTDFIEKLEFLFFRMAAKADAGHGQPLTLYPYRSWCLQFVVIWRKDGAIGG